MLHHHTALQPHPLGPGAAHLNHRNTEVGIDEGCGSSSFYCAQLSCERKKPELRWLLIVLCHVLVILDVISAQSVCRALLFQLWQKSLEDTRPASKFSEPLHRHC